MATAKKQPDDELMCEILCYHQLIDREEILECLGFANEIFETGRMKEESRTRSEEILSALKKRSAGGGTKP